MNSLRGYQHDMIDFALRRLYVEGEKGAALFADPGLGKTRAALEIVRTLVELGEVKRVLVVCPLRVGRLVWPQEIEKWGFDLPHNDMCQWRKTYNLPLGGVIDITNFESLHHFTSMPDRYDLILVDESYKLKTWTTKRMKSMRKMLPNIPRRLILTGTPVAYSLADLFSQIFILDDGKALGRNVTVFRARFMDRGGWQGREWKLRKGCEEELLDAVKELAIRLDAESNLDMPELVFNDVKCELPIAVRPQYKKLKKELLAQLESGEVFAVNAASAYMKCKQFSNGAVYDEERNVLKVHDEKLDALCDVVGELGGKPVLVFYQFRHDETRIKEKFPDAETISGSTNPEDLHRIMGDWNSGRLRILLAQNQAASHGLNLQDSGASDVVYFGLCDSPEVFEQSYRRIYRQNVQGKQVRVHRLVCASTVDTVIADRVDGKLRTQAEFLNALKKHARTR